MHREAVADGDERGALEELRARVGDAEEELAVAERLVVGDVDAAQPEVAAAKRGGQRLDVVAPQMRADDDRLHFRPVRTTASTLARTMFRPR